MIGRTPDAPAGHALAEPIEEGVAEVEEVEGGDLDMEVEAHEGGERGSLKKPFKGMAESLRAHGIGSAEEGRVLLKAGGASAILK